MQMKFAQGQAFSALVGRCARPAWHENIAGHCIMWN
jgi:hypothetical protein